MRTKLRFTYNGRLVTIKELAELTGVSARLISSRLQRGWNIEDAISKPIQSPKRYEYGGKCLTREEWAKELGISESTLRQRLYANLPYDEVFKKELRYKPKIPYSTEEIMPFFNQLSEQEKAVVEMHLEGMTHNEIAAEMGVTKQRISFIERSILKKYFPEKC